MKKYEISEEELQTLIGVAAARACDDDVHRAALYPDPAGRDG